MSEYSKDNTHQNTLELQYSKYEQWWNIKRGLNNVLLMMRVHPYWMYFPTWVVVLYTIVELAFMLTYVMIKFPSIPDNLPVVYLLYSIPSSSKWVLMGILLAYIPLSIIVFRIVYMIYPNQRDAAKTILWIHFANILLLAVSIFKILSISGVL